MAAPNPTDLRSRPLRDLRISVTDRCNFRCSYCMPKEFFGRDFHFLPASALLSFEEIERLTRVFAGLGARKLRLTGGEPLVRRGIETLVSMLARVDGIRDIAMTTNGALLAAKAAALREAGLQRLTVSLDSLDDAVFRAMNDVDFPVAGVLRGIEAAEAAGFKALKINCVVKRGVNDAGIADLARRFRGTGHIVRFIEYMDVGTTNGWRMTDVVSGAEILARLREHFALEPAEPNYRGEVAERYRYADGSGEIGIIASVTRPFCGDCSRARVSSEGRVYTCLFAGAGHDVRALLRDGSADDEIAAFLRRMWSGRDDRYSEVRAMQTAGRRKVEMSHIGG